MHNPLRNAFMVEMRNLLAKYEIFEQSGSAPASLQRILIIGDDDALICSEGLTSPGDLLVSLAAFGSSCSFFFVWLMALHAHQSITD